MTLEICFHMQQKQKLQQFLHSLMVQDTKTKKKTEQLSLGRFLWHLLAPARWLQLKLMSSKLLLNWQ